MQPIGNPIIYSTNFSAGYRPISPLSVVAEKSRSRRVPAALTDDQRREAVAAVAEWEQQLNDLRKI